MSAPIAIGDTFTLKRGTRVDTFRRDADDPAPMFECERIRLTHLSCSDATGWPPGGVSFGADPEWFRQRGLVVAEGGA